MIMTKIMKPSLLRLSSLLFLNSAVFHAGDLFRTAVIFLILHSLKVFMFIRTVAMWRKSYN